MSFSYESEMFQTWKETLIEILGETAEGLLEKRVIEKLKMKKALNPDEYERHMRFLESLLQEKV